VLLAELGVRVLRWLAARENWDWPETAFEAAVRMFREDEAGLPEAARTRDTGIPIPRDLYRSLSLGEWTAQTGRQRDELAESLTGALNAAGQPLRLIGVRDFGPTDDLSSGGVLRPALRLQPEPSFRGREG
jgi:hypothetical protein